VFLIPKNNTVWDVWEKNIKKYKRPFMTKHNQSKGQQEREGLDEIFG